MWRKNTEELQSLPMGGEETCDQYYAPSRLGFSSLGARVWKKDPFPDSGAQHEWHYIASRVVDKSSWYFHVVHDFQSEEPSIESINQRIEERIEGVWVAKVLSCKSMVCQHRWWSRVLTQIVCRHRRWNVINIEYGICKATQRQNKCKICVHWDYKVAPHITTAIKLGRKEIEASLPGYFSEWDKLAARKKEFQAVM